MAYRKKLIEVALPLEAINQACKPETENPFLKDHPRAIHNWWARTPLVACRAVIFASLVDDPGGYCSDPEEVRTERERLSDLLRRLARWDSTTDEAVLMEARREIARSVARNADVPEPQSDEEVWQVLDEHAPPVLDPFCGRGSIPLEAQRLGLKAYASDLNPVAALITKELVELPPMFAGKPPVNPESRHQMETGAERRGALGLAEDVRYYGKWIKTEAFDRIGHLYPTGPNGETVIAWLWARTVKCPNPTCGAQMTLVASSVLSKKKGNRTWIEPLVDRSTSPPSIEFKVRTGEGHMPDSLKVGRGANFRCLACGQTCTDAQTKAEAMAGRMGVQMMAAVADGPRRRLYLDPISVKTAPKIPSVDTAFADLPLPSNARWFSPPLFGMSNYADLFSPRQLIALTTFSDLVHEVRERVLNDAQAAGLTDDGVGVGDRGSGAEAYADAVVLYLACAVSRLTDYHNSLATWNPTNENVRNLFQRQAIPMAWDFCEANPFLKQLSMEAATGWVAGALSKTSSRPFGFVDQANAVDGNKRTPLPIVITDPPYYDNIGYADLSDFFYVWLRRSVGHVLPSLFGTVLTPKRDELIATPYRHDGDTKKAMSHFREGIRTWFGHVREDAHPDYPVVLFYAFRQEEKVSNGRASTGWETMLEGLLETGFQITSTLPFRTTKSARSVARGTNSLASAIVIAARPVREGRAIATRQEYVSALQYQLQAELKQMRLENIAPVDMEQAAIGPGMAIFSGYSQVVMTSGEIMSVREALALINEQLDAFLAETEGDLDPETRFCAAWFEEFGFQEDDFGRAEILMTALNTALNALEQAGVFRAAAGKARLIRRDELPEDWDPVTDRRLTVWECTQHLVKMLDREGESGAARLVSGIGSGMSENARDLAYRLYNVCERKNRSGEARGYNALVSSWGRISDLARRQPTDPQQPELDL